MTYNNVFDFLNSQIWYLSQEKFAEMSARIRQIGTEEGMRMATEFKPPAAPKVNSFAQEREVDEFYEYAGVSLENGLAVMKMRGVVSKYASIFSNVSGGIALETSIKAVQMLTLDPKVKGVLLKMDSPGGTALGLSALGKAVNVLSKVKPTYALSDDTMASAAYYIGCSVGPDRLFVTPDSMTGSIGAIMSRWDYSEGMKEAGIKQYVWRSAPYKALGAPAEGMTEKEDGDSQRLVDSYHKLFVEHIGNYRFGGDIESANKLADGRIHVGLQTLDINMADEVKTFNEAYAALREEIESVDATGAGAERVHMSLSGLDDLKMKSDAAINALQKERDDLKAQLEAKESINASEKATNFISSLVEKGKVPSAIFSDTDSDQYKSLHASLIKDYDNFSAPFAYITEGTYSPGSVDIGKAPESGVEAKKAKAQELGVEFTLTSEGREMYLENGWTEVSLQDAEKNPKGMNFVYIK